MSDPRNDEQAPDEQDRAEALDVDNLGDGSGDDPVGELEYPPERPLGVNQYGTTAAEERAGEPRDERARRDTPDPLAQIAEPDEAELREIERDEDEFSDFDNGDGDGDGDGDVGRLVEPGADDDAFDLEDIEAEAIASRADIDERDLSAEEAAVHLTRDPPLGELGDGYLDEETT